MAETEAKKFRRHLGALMRKNVLLKRRSPCSTCCELFLAVGAVLLLVVARYLASDVEDLKFPAQHHVTNAMPVRLPDCAEYVSECNVKFLEDKNHSVTCVEGITFGCSAGSSDGRQPPGVWVSSGCYGTFDLGNSIPYITCYSGHRLKPQICRGDAFRKRREGRPTHLPKRRLQGRTRIVGGEMEKAPGENEASSDAEEDLGEDGKGDEEDGGEEDDDGDVPDEEDERGSPLSSSEMLASLMASGSQGERRLAARFGVASADPEGARLFQHWLTSKQHPWADSVHIFSSAEAVQSELESPGYPQRNLHSNRSTYLCGAVIFDTSPRSPHVQYTLRFNRSLPKDPNLPPIAAMMMSTKIQSESLIKNKQDSGPKRFDKGGMTWYTQSGFLSLQRTVDTFLEDLQEQGPAKILDAGTRSEPGHGVGGSWLGEDGRPHAIVPFPTPEWKRDIFAIMMPQLLALFLLMSLAYSVNRMITSVVHEREARLRDGMRMMGMHPIAFYMSWVLTYMAIYTYVGLLVVLFLSQGNILPRSSPTLLFVWIMLFAAASIAYALVITTFFQKAKTAATVGSIMFYASSHLVNLAEVNSTTAFLRLMSLFPPVCFELGARLFADSESQGMGITWANASHRTDFQRFSVLDSCGMLAVDSVVLLLLFVYLDMVMPRDTGLQLPWYFPLKPSFWRELMGAAASPQDMSAEGAAQDPEVPENSALVEKDIGEAATVMARNGQVVRLQALSKTFGDIRAVQGLDLVMYQGEIFALLGHNGAGKTTTLGMLCGLMPPSRGSCEVFGHCLASEPAQVQKLLGVCPQHDVLWEELTCEEHLMLFAGFKGVPRADAPAEVTTMLHRVGLFSAGASQRQAGRLSGGMKRKLSLGIAFLGDSRLVVLDEPTSGLDPYSRRLVWELLRAMKHARVTVLSTHYMDEADILGDRIAILHEGRLRCCGSPQFLKRAYDCGYNITLVKQPGCQSEAVRENLCRHMPELTSEVVTLSDSGNELILQFPFAAARHFSTVLGSLEQQLAELRVESYGVSITTLEEVFLKVASGETVERQAPPFPDGTGSESDGSERYIELQDVPAASSQAREVTIHGARGSPTRLRIWGSPAGSDEERGEGGAAKAEEEPGLKRASRQLAALVRKRWRYGMRDRRGLLCQLFLPSGTMLVLLCILSHHLFHSQPALELEVKSYNEGCLGEPQNLVDFTHLASIDEKDAEDMLKPGVPLWNGDLRHFSPEEATDQQKEHEQLLTSTAPGVFHNVFLPAVRRVMAEGAGSSDVATAMAMMKRMREQGKGDPGEILPLLKKMRLEENPLFKEIPLLKEALKREGIELPGDMAQLETEGIKLPDNIREPGDLVEALQSEGIDLPEDIRQQLNSRGVALPDSIREPGDLVEALQKEGMELPDDIRQQLTSEGIRLPDGVREPADPVEALKSQGIELPDDIRMQLPERLCKPPYKFVEGQGCLKTVDAFGASLLRDADAVAEARRRDPSFDSRLRDPALTTPLRVGVIDKAARRQDETTTLWKKDWKDWDADPQARKEFADLVKRNDKALSAIPGIHKDPAFDDAVLGRRLRSNASGAADEMQEAGVAMEQKVQSYLAEVGMQWWALTSQLKSGEDTMEGILSHFGGVKSAFDSLSANRSRRLQAARPFFGGPPAASRGRQGGGSWARPDARTPAWQTKPGGGAPWQPGVRLPPRPAGGAFGNGQPGQPNGMRFPRFEPQFPGNGGLQGRVGYGDIDEAGFSQFGGACIDAMREERMLWRAADTNHDGQLSLEEAKQMMNNLYKMSGARLGADEARRKELEDKVSEISAKALFVAIRGDYTGTISENEFCEVGHQMREELEHLYNLAHTFSEQLLESSSQCPRYGAYYVIQGARKDSSPKWALGADAVVFVNTTSMHAAPVFQSALTNARFSRIGLNKQVSVRIHPFPQSKDEQRHLEQFASFFLAVYITLCLSFIPAGIAHSVVKERSSGARQLQVLSGASHCAYWLANLIYDLAMYSVPALCIPLALQAYGFRMILSGECGMAVCAVLVAFGPAVAGFSYVASFAFKDHSKASNSILSFCLIGGFIFSTIIFILTVMNYDPSAEHPSGCDIPTEDFPEGTCTFPKAQLMKRIVSPIFRMVPTVCVCHALFCIALVANLKEVVPAGSLEAMQAITGGKGSALSMSPFAWEWAGEPLLYLVVEAFAFCLLAVLLDACVHSPRFSKWVDVAAWLKRIAAWRARDGARNVDLSVATGERLIDGAAAAADADGIGDESVEAERALADTARPEDVALRVWRLEKTYRHWFEWRTAPKRAVKGVSLALNSGEVFGLLGHNGAGKTSALKCLIGELCCTSGTVHVGGCNMETETSKARRRVGYCPQSDALLELLTVKDHLELFGALKGVSTEAITEAPRQFKLEKMLHRRADFLSGGNKRKLSAAISLLGSPALSVLDEPSCGLDPAARRALWVAIHTAVAGSMAMPGVGRVVKPSCVLLTTHSMEEAEALSSRLGILADGLLLTVGTSQQIKQRRGKSHELCFTLRPETEDTLASTLQQLGGDALQPGTKLALQSVAPLLEAAPDKKRAYEGARCVVRAQLESSGWVEASVLAEWWIQQSRGEAIHEFLRGLTGEGVELAENFGLYWRFCLPHSSVGLPEMFGQLESRGKELGIAEYTLTQATLEQIFNNIAQGAEDQRALLA